MAPITECAFYVDGQWVEDAGVEQLESVLLNDVRSANDFVWVSVDQPDHESLESLQRNLHLHELEVEDMESAHQRPKLEEYDHSLLLVLRTGGWNASAAEVELGETHIAVGPQHVLTVHHGSSPAGSTFRARCQHVPSHPERGPMYALHVVFDTVVDEWVPVIDALEELVEALEERLLADEVDQELIREVYAARASVASARRAVAPLIEITNRLTLARGELVPATLRPYFRDVHDHVLRLNDRLDDLRELTGAAVQTHVALVSLRQNDITKKLASWAAIIAVPTMVAGIYGMNFDHLPGLNSAAVLAAVSTVTLSLCAGLFARFRHVGWL
ncbi:MAG: magnesium and cobalt transport protein CorA [Candidatus Binatia bacterium]|nr:magnesium and cobalt transport protein CorA [Candidatus Binatia bacterium]